MCVPPFTCFCFGKGCCHSARWKKGLLHKQQPKNYSRHTLCSPCHRRIQGRSFTTLDVRSFITSPGFGSSVQSFLAFLTTEADIGMAGMGEPCSTPRSAMGLFFSQASFQQGNLPGRCKIMCPVFVLGLGACSFCVLSWNIICYGHSTFADVKNQVFSWDTWGLLTKAPPCPC